MAFENKISVEQAIRDQGITAEQIGEAYAAFRRTVNPTVNGQKVVVYRHSEANLSMLMDLVFQDSGVRGLLFATAWLEAFHNYSHQLPDQPKTPEELFVEKQQAEADRAAELEARDREAGRPQRHLSEGDIEAEKDRRQKAYEDAKAALERRVSDIRNAEAPAQPTMADAYDALRSTQLERAALVKWIRETPTEFLLSVRKLPFSTTETWGQKIDAVVAAGKTNA